jgi:glycosyltransferase involved in cell wall biosynthesis
MEKKIAILLPYKEKFTNNKAGAASIWVKDYLSGSKLNETTTVYGNLDKKYPPILKNYSNIDISNFSLKKNLSYTKKFYQLCVKNNHKIIEIHNRPESLLYFHKMNKEKKFKLIFIFHNNPLELRGSRNVSERIDIIEKTDYIFFVSKWVKNKFFQNIPEKHRNNCEVLYPSIKQQSIFNKSKKKNIIFTGKLNSSKGYDIFLKTVIKILNKYRDWTATVIGNEPREKFYETHKNLKIYAWKKHDEILRFYNNSSISVVNSKWDEPFGRTAMESAALGCATIISNNGGLTETFNSDLILKKNNENELYNMLSKIIDNAQLLKKIQKKNFNNVIHKIKDKIKILDQIKNFLLIEKFNFLRSKQKRIIHISTFDERNNHRLFNISLANKITKGFIRNGHDVINFSYRNYLNPINKNNTNNIENTIFEISKNYKPDLIVLGHNNILSANTLQKIKSANNTKFILWYEDALSKKSDGPSWKSNLELIEKNSKLIDAYFTTTHPDNIINSKIPKAKLNFLPMLVDQNIENQKFYNYKNKFKDLFFAFSHGVNFGKLKPNKYDEREFFLNELFNQIVSKNSDLKLNILGIANQSPKWNYDFYNEVIKCKMALNLSRGLPIKYSTSNRIASLVANGVYTFIDEKTRFNDFFSEDEMGFYKNINDLLNKVELFKNNPNKYLNFAKKGAIRYFELFNSKKISKYLIDRSYNLIDDKVQIWEKY